MAESFKDESTGRVVANGGPSEPHARVQIGRPNLSRAPGLAKDAGASSQPSKWELLGARPRDKPPA